MSPIFLSLTLELQLFLRFYPHNRYISVKSTDIGVEDNENRWLVVGLAMNKVVVPELRRFVAKVLDDLYVRLKNYPTCIDQQAYGKQYTHHPPKQPTGAAATTGLKPKELQYGNINSNSSRFGKDKTKWNYDVTSSIDLAKLFFQSFMAKCRTYDECDASAVLGLIREVDDSTCQDAFKHLRADGGDLKNIRNMWAHCNYKEWDEEQYNRAFDTMQNIMDKLSVKSDVSNSFQNWKKHGKELV